MPWKSSLLRLNETWLATFCCPLSVMKMQPDVPLFQFVTLKFDDIELSWILYQECVCVAKNVLDSNCRRPKDVRSIPLINLNITFIGTWDALGFFTISVFFFSNPGWKVGLIQELDCRNWYYNKKSATDLLFSSSRSTRANFVSKLLPQSGRKLTSGDKTEKGDLRGVTKRTAVEK